MHALPQVSVVSYVWLNFMAYLPCDMVDKMFRGCNLFNVAENMIHFKGMIGLGDKKLLSALVNLMRPN